MRVEVGQKAAYQRTFTLEDVHAFADLTGDKGLHHMEPDSKGRIMVQGLLTASIPTKLGGDMNYIAGTMNFQFLRPVFIGDAIACESVVTEVKEAEGRQYVSIDVVCRNQDGKEVLRGTTEGMIRA